MSNIAGKSYAMNVITPIKWYMVPINKIIFWLAGTKIFSSRLNGLITLSLIHYARWAIVKPKEFPRLDESQPEEDIRYTYMFFFSNFNGSWEQYVDSFSSAIPNGLDLLWYKNVNYPNSLPLHSFHDYIFHNQIWTNHYYSAYPLASSNDVKAAKRVKNELISLIDKSNGVTAKEFKNYYDATLRTLQNDLSKMEKTPIVSLAAQAVMDRRKEESAHTEKQPVPLKALK